VTCRCDTFQPAHAQTLCAECAAHRVGECATCRLAMWWTDLFQRQGTNGRVTELCAECVTKVEVALNAAVRDVVAAKKVKP